MEKKAAADFRAWMKKSGIFCNESEPELQALLNVCEKDNFTHKIGPKFMMASYAYHFCAGDAVDSDCYDLCRIHSEFGNFYIGSWVTGLGMLNTIFPKATTRKLYPNEEDKYSSCISPKPLEK